MDRRSRLLIYVLALLALIAGACGSDEDESLVEEELPQETLAAEEEAPAEQEPPAQQEAPAETSDGEVTEPANDGGGAGEDAATAVRQSESDTDSFVVTSVSAERDGSTLTVQVVTNRPISDNLAIFDTSIGFRIDNAAGQSLIGTFGGIFDGEAYEPSVGCLQFCGLVPVDVSVEGTTYTMTFELPPEVELDPATARLTANAYEFKTVDDASVAPVIVEGVIKTG